MHINESDVIKWLRKFPGLRYESDANLQIKAREYIRFYKEFIDPKLNPPGLNIITEILPCTDCDSSGSRFIEHDDTLTVSNKCTTCKGSGKLTKTVKVQPKL